MSHYLTSLQHILDEMERIHLLVCAQVWRARQTQPDDELRPFYISEQEVDRLLAAPAGLPRWATAPVAPPPAALAEAVAQRAADIAQRKQASAGRGVRLRLVTLAHLFHLSAFDADALLICLAPELDLRYERLYAYLQDNISHKRPTVDLVLNLLCPSFDAKLAARRAFLPGAPLLRHELVQIVADPADPLAPLPARLLKLDERIAAFLLDGDEPDAALQPFVQVVAPPAHGDAERQSDLHTDLHADLHARLVALAHAQDTVHGPLVYAFHGPDGAGQAAGAQALAAGLARPLLRVAGDRLLAQGPPFAAALRRVLREAQLQDAVLYWQGVDPLLTAEHQAESRLLLDALAEWRGPTLVAGARPWDPPGACARLTIVPVEFAHPPAAARARLWAAALNGTAPAAGLDLADLAAKFRLTPGQIQEAAAQAQTQARWRDPAAPALTPGDLYAACRGQAAPRLEGVARKIVPHYTWDDIVLPAACRRQLVEICNQVKYRARVYDAWGFDRKLALGKGLSALFTGPSGTGKTMAADILAGALGLDLYQIDLAGVVSKYIGETEKNLAHIFAAAETSHAILFFDEADALFGKRSEVRDAHDRYANIETSYLLQRMEAYAGIAILASNFPQNLDEAFVRRMHFTVEFPFPDVRDRRRIWEQIWPETLPRSPALDLDFMAARFELAGGHIRNIALGAAFLAASSAAPPHGEAPNTGAPNTEPPNAEPGPGVEMAHLIRATQREYQKMGKLVLADDFGPYAGDLN